MDRLVDDQVAVPGRGRRVAPIGPIGTIAAAPPAPSSASAAAPTMAALAFASQVAGLNKGYLFSTGKISASQVAGLGVGAAGPPRTTGEGTRGAGTSPANPPTAREVTRPDPASYVASDPYVLIRRAGRSSRFGGDGAWRRDGKLLDAMFLPSVRSALVLERFEDGAIAHVYPRMVNP